MATNQLDPALLEAPPAQESGLQRTLRWMRENMPWRSTRPWR